LLHLVGDLFELCDGRTDLQKFKVHKLIYFFEIVFLSTL